MGQQCVAMSLCSLIYNARQRITSGHDLISIMNIGNQLYSSLSQLARQSNVMQTELLTMLNVFEADYQLEYSDIELFWHCASRHNNRRISVLYLFTTSL